MATVAGTDPAQETREEADNTSGVLVVLIGLIASAAIGGVIAAIVWLVAASDRPFDELQPTVTVIGWALAIAIVCVLTLVGLLIRRLLVATERHAELTAKHVEIATSHLESIEQARSVQSEANVISERSERYNSAIAQATAGSAALRAIGLLALEKLAADYDEHFAATIYEFLVTVFKEKATPDQATGRELDSAPKAEKPSPERMPPLDPDVTTALSILARNRELFDRNVEALAVDTEKHGGTGVHLLDTDLSGIWLRGVPLAGATLTNVRLDEAVIVDVDLHDAVLTNTRAGNATFDEVDFTHGRFNSARFAESTFTETRFDRATMSAADFGEAAITKTSFKRANATGTGFVGAVIIDSAFDEALLTGASFQSALFTELRGATSTFTKATLSSVAFAGATLTGTKFDGAAVNDVDFSGTKMTDVSFDGGSIRQTTYADASLTDVTFNDASMSDVVLDREAADG